MAALHCLKGTREVLVVCLGWEMVRLCGRSATLAAQNADLREEGTLPPFPPLRCSLLPHAAASVLCRWIGCVGACMSGAGARDAAGGGDAAACRKHTAFP